MESLNARIHRILYNQSRNAASSWNTYTPIIEPSSEIRSDLIRVNTFLRIQLGMLNVDTTIVRECLDNGSDIDEWVSNFETYIAPVIIEHGLPIWQGSICA